MTDLGAGKGAQRTFLERRGERHVSNRLMIRDRGTERREADRSVYAVPFDRCQSDGRSRLSLWLLEDVL